MFETIWINHLYLNWTHFLKLWPTAVIVFIKDNTSPLSEGQTGTKTSCLLKDYSIFEPLPSTPVYSKWRMTASALESRSRTSSAGDTLNTKETSRGGLSPVFEAELVFHLDLWMSDWMCVKCKPHCEVAGLHGCVSEWLFECVSCVFWPCSTNTLYLYSCILVYERCRVVIVVAV